MPKTVLAVDDDAQTLQLIRSALQRRYKVWTFSDPYKALASVQEGVRPQLVLCNHQLFGMTGSEFRSQLRSHLLMGKVPFVFLLNLSERSEAKALNERGDRFLQLPLSEVELVALVDHYLAVPGQF
ncbi:MAG: response regulator [Truepera sp.]|nr:response regulator [Truepera sp.]